MAVEKKMDFTKLEKRIKPVSKLPFKVSALFYGRSGTGKTTLAADFPKPALLLDVFEEGQDSIADVEGVFVLPIETWADFELAYWYIVKKGTHFKTVIIDTLTQLQDTCMADILEHSKREMATKREWGQLSQRLKAWIVHFRDLPQNTVFLCQDRTSETDTDEEDQIIPEVGPRLSPSIAGVLNAAVKVIGQTYIKEQSRAVKGKMRKETQYRLRVGPHPYYLTKIRAPKSSFKPDSLVNPSFQDIVAVMRGEYQPPTPEVKEKQNGKTKAKTVQKG